MTVPIFSSERRVGANRQVPWMANDYLVNSILINGLNHRVGVGIFRGVRACF